MSEKFIENPNRLIMPETSFNELIDMYLNKRDTYNYNFFNDEDEEKLDTMLNSFISDTDKRVEMSNKITDAECQVRYIAYQAGFKDAVHLMRMLQTI